MSSRASLFYAIGLFALAHPQTALAEQADSDESAATDNAEAQKPIIVLATPVVRKNKHILSDTALDDQRGGQAMIVTNQTLLAISEGNTLNGDYTAGNVSISDNALSGFNGVGNVLINTGAQVNLQAGMNLTINMTDE
jgi:hypothetical protein